MVLTQGRRDRGEGAAKIAEKSHFHGKAEKDPVTGRSWLEPPKDLAKAATEYCYLPKKWVHTWSGHTKGVNAIRRARPALCCPRAVIIYSVTSTIKCKFMHSAACSFSCCLQSSPLLKDCLWTAQ